MKEYPEADDVFLVLDSAGPEVQVGLVQGNRWLAFVKSRADALEAIFFLTRKVLVETGLSLPGIAGFLYCGGPGSILGVRLTCMALTTWRTLQDDFRPIFRYNSLQLTAAKLRGPGQNESQLLLAPMRKDQYLGCMASAEELDNLIILSTLEVHQITPNPQLLVMRHPLPSSMVPRGSVPIEYRINDLPELLHQQKLVLDPISQPEPFHFQPLDYRKWSGERHRAP